MMLGNWVMPAKMDEADKAPEVFTLHNGVLRAKRDLYWEYLEEFEAACKELVKSRRSMLELDLSSVNFISSSFLGCLSTTVLRASRLKKRIRLKVSLDVSWLFDIMGVEKNLDMEVH